MARRANQRTWVVITIVLMACVSPSAAKVIYVDANAPGPTYDGSSWETAYKYLQNALADANSSTKPIEIRVAQGIYKPDQSSTDPNGSGDRTATFQLINGVTIKGGYAGFGQPDPNTRDIKLYETILSGDLAGNDIEVDPCDLLDEPTRAENSYIVVLANSTDVTSVLDGFTITACNGKFFFPPPPYVKTGGMCNLYADPTITSCTFSANAAFGGRSAMYNLESNPALLKCTFTNNYGSAMYNMECSPSVTNCIFSGNSAISWGGGMRNNSSSPTVTNCTFADNTADQGGGMANWDHSSPTVTNCTFSGNITEGEMATGGGGMANWDYSSPILTNCTFSGNSAYNVGGMASGGGGMANWNHSSPTVTNCTFSDNTASNLGGGMANWEHCNPTLTNCTFSSNHARAAGGMLNDVSSPALANCTFTNNSAELVTGGMFNSVSAPTLMNCILWGNTPEEINSRGDTPVITYSDVRGGLPGLGNIDADPCFADPCNGDYHLKSQAGRWDPNSKSWVQDYVSSPCIDAGNPGCPEANEPAPNGNRTNMGAYGGTAEASKSPGNGRNIADLTNDWAVDSNDLKVFADYWLETGDCIPGDLDRSRSADFNDYSIFASQWLHKENSVAIFIDSNTHSNLTSQIQRLKSDIINDLGVNVFIFSDNWNDIKEIKDILIDKYNHEGLIGAIFIGQIPTAYFEYQNSGSVPTDRYFQDLSDKFIDVDGDGKFEREYYMGETDVMMREIWTGRIKPPVGGSEGVALLRNYLDRNHNYRTGNLTYDRKMLYYGSVSINQGGMSQDDYNDLVNQIDDYTGLYDSDDDVNSIYHSDLVMQKKIYLTELQNKYDFVFVNIHGTTIHQWLGENKPGDQTVVYHYEIKEFRPQSLFTALASCSNGDFTTENYFAGWYLFSGNSLVVKANSTVSMLVGATEVQFLRDYIPLGLGVTFGDMDKNDLSFLVSHILGDPTLTLRPKPTGDLPRLSLHTSDIDFGDVERGSSPEKYLSFWNGGTALLEINYKKPCFSINGEYVDLGYWDVFYYTHPNTGETFRDFEVRPGKCKVVPFGFYPRADGPTGRYTMTILFQTNDPENPYIEIHLSGNAI